MNWKPVEAKRVPMAHLARMQTLNVGDDTMVNFCMDLRNGTIYSQHYLGQET